MNKKIFTILIITLFITCAFTTTASSTNFTNTKKTKEILPANLQAPIQPIVETEQIDSRTWNIKVYAYNTLDEEVTINTMPDMVNTVIDIQDENYARRVYFSFGPAKKRILTLICEGLEIYPCIKTFSANEKVLLDEYTFEGKTNLPLWLRILASIPWRLPAGLYNIGISMWYQYNGENQGIGDKDITYITLE